MKKLFLIFLIFINFNVKSQMATGFSSFIPGLGQTLNGNYLEGLGYLSSVIFFSSQKDLKLQMVGQNIWFYGMYDAWRDAGGKPSEHTMPIWAHYLENFNPVNIFDPISIGYIGMAFSSRSLARQEAEKDAKARGDSEYLHRIHYSDGWKTSLMFGAVGLGEEALFRGFLYPAFSDYLGEWGGAITSSLIFGYIHRGNRFENLVRSVMGMIFCWQYSRNGYRLGPNIFAHSWYDQILIGPMYISDSANPLRRKLRGLKFSFKF